MAIVFKQHHPSWGLATVAVNEDVKVQLDWSDRLYRSILHFGGFREFNISSPCVFLLYPTPFPISFHSPSLPRLTHDISLNEFEDDDLSEITEITDECGMSLNYMGLEIKVR